MKVQFNLVGEAAMELDQLEGHDSLVFTEMEHIPREGDVIDFPGISQALTIVRTVVWYPFGCDEYKEGEEMHGVPFVYLVIGNPRL